MNYHKKLVKWIIKNNIKISSCESITGGFFSSYFIKHKGASSFYLGSIIAYSNFAKENIVLIDKNLINKYSSVSKEVAISMAVKTNKIFSSNLCVSFTGIAGPDSIRGTDKKVGNIFIGISYNENIFVKELNLKSENRIINIKKTVLISIKWILQLIKEGKIK